MLVSSKFCEEHMQLVFTILERTEHSDVKCTILMHCSDLLERFPNVVEPWTPNMYARYVLSITSNLSFLFMFIYVGLK